MRSPLQLVAVATLVALISPAALARAQIFTQPVSAPPPPPAKAKHPKPRHQDLEWMWQYGPPPDDGRENDLLQDPDFLPMLEDNLVAPQSFWGGHGTAKKTLAQTAYDFLSVPGKVIAEDDRYLSISGCVFHFCPSRGLLWVDLNPPTGKERKNPNLIVFSAIDWIRDSKPTSNPAAEYTLWVFPNEFLGLAPNAPNGIPAALVRSISRWAAEPMVGTHIVQNITHIILVDPDGTPHQLPLDALGIKPPKDLSNSSNNPANKKDPQ